MAIKEWASMQFDRLEDLSPDRKQAYNHIIGVFSDQKHMIPSAEYTLFYINSYILNGHDAIMKALDENLGKSKEEEDPEVFEMQREANNNIRQIVDLIVQYQISKEELEKLYRIMCWRPIVPVTGIDIEWEDISEREGTGKIIEQNKISPSVFRIDHDNSTAVFTEGRVFSNNGGYTWFVANTKDLSSTIKITLPFVVPDEPEYVYLNGKDSTEIITDENRKKELRDEYEAQINSQIEAALRGK